MDVPRLHLVTDDAILARPDFVATATAVAEALGEALGEGGGLGGASGGAGDAGRPPGGGVVLHLRGPGSSGRFLFQRGEELLERLEGSGVRREGGVRVVVNDRADVARALGADGVHLPARGLPSSWVREWMGVQALVGRSLSPGEGLPPEWRPLDWLVVGTLWPSGSHPGRPGAGPERLRAVGEALAGGGLEEEGGSLPLVGIGGITPARVSRVLEEGGHGVAVRSGVWDAPDPVAAALDYARALRVEPNGTGGGR